MSRPWPSSYGLLAAFWSAAAVTAIAVVAGGARHPAAALGALVAATAMVAARTTFVTVPALAAIAWLFDNGFFVDRHAQLTWHGTADCWRLGILLAAALAGGLIGVSARRRARRTGHGHRHGHDRPPGLRGGGDWTREQAAAVVSLAEVRKLHASGHTEEDRHAQGRPLAEPAGRLADRARG
jgi:hypothetical protein